MFKKILTASLVTVSLVGATLAATGTAEARSGRNGAFAAGAVLGLVGGALLASPGYAQPSYEPAYTPVYYRRHRCHFEQRFVDDYYGGHYVNVKVCY